MKETVNADEKVIKKHPPEHDTTPGHDIPERTDKPRFQETPQSGITLLQQQVGNRAVQRLLTQRSSSEPFEVEDETAQRIEKERGGGQALDSTMQEQMGAKMGYDFSQVKVHASPESDALNRELGAEAFTTGKDIYFRQGAYDPHSTGGQELLAHEMTHVVQQSGGMAGDGTKMTVNAPDDTYEKNADSVAQEVTSSPGTIQTEEVQKQAVPEEEEEVQMRRVQCQELPEEEEELKKKKLEEEELQMRRVQREEVPEEEEEFLQTKRSRK